MMKLARFAFFGMGLLLVVMCLFPRHGPPDFRYTGSDPAIDVWNFGWPTATMIWDSRSGLHFASISPSFLLLAMYGFAMLVFVVISRKRRHVNPN